MFRIWNCFQAACSLILAIGTASAFDPRDAGILRLRLGMGEPEALTHLAEQGITGSLLQQARACSTEPVPYCWERIVARTRDGVLTIDFAGPPAPSGADLPRISSILYRLNGRAPHEAEIIRESVLDRFGRPATWQPLVWCAHPAPDDTCPPGQPILTFNPGSGHGSQLLLTNGAQGSSFSTGTLGGQ